MMQTTLRKIRAADPAIFKPHAARVGGADFAQGGLHHAAPSMLSRHSDT